MRFSIIVPMYNVEQFLGDSINSALNQTYKNFELILVNDGSTDNTLAIAKKYKDIDGRIKILNQINSGTLQARVNGLKKSTGNYIVFLDADDFLELNMLKILDQTIKETNSDLILFGLNRVDTKGNKYETNSINLKSLNKDEIIKKFINSSGLNSLGIKCINAKLLKEDIIEYEKIGHIVMTEDRLQSFYPLLFCENIVVLEKKLYNYRLDPNSSTQTFSKKKMHDSIKAHKILNANFKEILSKDLFKDLLVQETMDTITKYLIWLSTNNVNKEESFETLNQLTNLEYMKEAKNYIRGFKKKILYYSIMNKRSLTINMLIKKKKRKIKIQKRFS